MLLLSCGKTKGDKKADEQDQNQKHEWDSKKLCSEIIYDANGKECSKAIYIYNEFGRETGYIFTEYTGLDI